MENSINYKGFEIKVMQSDISDNPREWGNIGKMVCFHRRYILGDEHNFDSPEDFIEFAKGNKEIEVLPLYLYDHSGITISTGSFSDRWDSGLVGWVYCTKKIGNEEFGRNWRKKAIKHMEIEVKTYDQFLTGEVYGFITEDAEGEIIDSCSGYFGSNLRESGLLDEAESSIDYYIQQAKQSHFNRLKAWIKNNVPLASRKSFNLV